MNVDKGVIWSKLKIVVFGLLVFLLSFFLFYVYVFAFDYNSVATYQLNTEADREVNIVELSSVDIQDGKKVVLNPSLEAWVYMNDKYYSFELSEIFPSSNKASLYISEIPLNVVFEKGQERRFDLDSDGYYDVSIYLNKISLQEAEFLFRTSGGVVSTGDNVMMWFDNFQGLVSDDLERHNYLLLIFFVLIAILIVFIFYFSIPYFKSYFRAKKIRARKSYSEVMDFLIKEFNQAKRNNKQKAFRIYRRIDFVYRNLSGEEKVDFFDRYDKIDKEVNKWKDI